MRALARVGGIAGAIAVAWLVLRAGPRDVVLVYDLSSVPGARALEVEVLRGAEVLRRAEFRLAGGPAQVTHAVKLSPGDYVLRGRIDAPGGARAFERPLQVHEAGTIVLPLGG